MEVMDEQIGELRLRRALVTNLGPPDGWYTANFLDSDNYCCLQFTGKGNIEDLLRQKIDVLGIPFDRNYGARTLKGDVITDWIDKMPAYLKDKGKDLLYQD